MAQCLIVVGGYLGAALLAGSIGYRLMWRGVPEGPSSASLWVGDSRALASPTARERWTLLGGGPALVSRGGDEEVVGPGEGVDLHPGEAAAALDLGAEARWLVARQGWSRPTWPHEVLLGALGRG